MNDVDEGGYTVFTELGISVPPKKGSALVWHNYKKNGDHDKLSIHGGTNINFIVSCTIFWNSFSIQTISLTSLNGLQVALSYLVTNGVSNNTKYNI